MNTQTGVGGFIKSKKKKIGRVDLGGARREVGVNMMKILCI